MKPTPELIQAMRSAADTIERDVLESEENYYSHDETYHCNMGFLAIEILRQQPEWNITDFSSGEAALHAYEILGYWTFLGQRNFDQENRCERTGLPLNEVFSTLAKAGLDSPEDYADVEFLGKQSQILEDFNHTRYHFLGTSLIRPQVEALGVGTPEAAIAYFRAKADELEAQLAAQSTV